ncbi:MAG: beta-ketoacyl synthase N-terminal-like domain-containing protein [Acidimicrobiales bacterium]
MTAPNAEELSPMKRAILEIRDLRARLADAEARSTEPIAIVGMGLRFPGGVTDPDTFWQQLWSGTDAITEVPAERWAVDELYDADPDAVGRISTRFGGFVDGIDQFDASFFGISPREAESMDPQQRLLLEVTWEALERSGTSPDELFGGNTGIFLGISNSDYLRMLLADRDQIDAYTTTGNALSVAAGRLSYVLGVQGPAVSIDTACSSSLVAVHLAAQALRNGETDLALAGGVNLILAPELSINFSRARMLAPDGRCKTFDESADGYVRAEGCAMIVLKRLRDAQVDDDHILAVVRGSAVSQDGRSGGLTAPNGPSQEKVVAAALAAAGVAANEVGYVEAHGTGTPLGDPIEVRALGAVLCRGRSHDQPLLLGSVKTNVGHMEAAAGIGGLIKLVLMLEHQAIPPHLHLNTLSGYIASENLPIAVPTQPMPWDSNGNERIGGVSSFGLSGTNAHVIVSEAPRVATGTISSDGAAPSVLALSAKSPMALRDLAAKYAAAFVARPDQAFADVAYRANTGRSHFADRLAVVASSAPQAAEQLVAYAAGDAAAVITHEVTVLEPVVAFLFTGHGSHHATAGASLYAERPVFRAAIDRCDELLRGQLDRTLPDILFGAGDHLEQMVYAQPALFALQYALAELWQSWGVRPSLVAGHSAGEYVAAVVAGVMDLADGLRLITARGRLLQTLNGDGEMAALFVDEPRVALAVAPYSADVGIAAVNGPTTTVISGRAEAVRAVVADLALDDGEWRPLDISVAAHSPLVEPILDAFEGAVRGVSFGRPNVGLVSSMTGELVDDELATADYWRRHLRQPVRFAAVFDTLRNAGCNTFVEIGPHPTLLALGQRISTDTTTTWAPSMRRDSDESREIASSLARLYVAGVDVDWRGFDGGGPPHSHVELPTYPWQHESFWSPNAFASARRPATAVWPAVVAAAERQAEQGPLDLQLDRYPIRWQLFDRLAVAYIVAAVRDLGLFEGGEVVRVRALIEAGRIAPRYGHLADRWLEHLADEKLVERDGDGFVLTTPLVDPGIEGLLAEADAAFEGVEWFLAYLRRCGEHLGAVISGEENGLATLFPEGSYETVDRLYGTWAVARYFNAIVRAAARASADARPNRPLRVLEIGAGTGGTTATVLPALPADRTSYTFTDLSDFFLTRGAERFSAAFPFVDFAKFDIEQSPEDQGYAPGGYDLVIAANVLHATRDLDVTLDHARSLLAPGGVLIAYETTNHPRWFDITTGLIEGWQLFEDRWRDDHPLITADRWSEALAAAGFVDVVSVPGADEPTAIFGQALLFAHAPGEETAVARRHDSVGPRALASARSVVERPEAAAFAAALAAALPDERLEVLVEFVRQSIAHVLRIGDQSRLPREQPLLDAGFDSLMAVELRDVLVEGLGLDRKLPATLVFDHPNIVAMARYLEHLLANDPADQGAHSDAGVDATGRSDTPMPGARDVAGLSEDEVEALLLAKLTEIANR